MRIFRLAFVLMGAIALTACGFKPMHAPGAFNGKTYDFKQIAVATKAEEKIDFLLKQALRDRLGDNVDTDYILEIQPKLSRKPLGIGEDDVASRYDLSVSARFNLIDRKSGKSVHSSSVRALSTFAASRDPYGTVSAENNATEQIARETADRIIVLLAQYFDSAAAE